ncbi:hypothetical protein [Bradyrhizobium sp. STM 3843]|uniref:hypothetical protein n=1 Tax=Bradyrhizobium sp. STM 3843 TaxID=551947 RepID=UPI0002D30590|nr:hypothetical protein [Bradyrhizobium sp. STM 3843]
MDIVDIAAELREIEYILQDDRLSEEARFALMGASQALRHVLAPRTWQRASQTFYRLHARPDEATSSRLH